MVAAGMLVAGMILVAVLVPGVIVMMVARRLLARTAKQTFQQSARPILILRGRMGVAGVMRVIGRSPTQGFQQPSAGAGLSGVDLFANDLLDLGSALSPFARRLDDRFGLDCFLGCLCEREGNHHQSSRYGKESRSHPDSAVAAVHAYISRCEREET
ncbi:MAG: hypothetical protein MI861_10135 [Pirellulales bacterium]|nr:hypothetical protein [Pirellulales bacterium]